MTGGASPDGVAGISGANLGRHVALSSCEQTCGVKFARKCLDSGEPVTGDAELTRGRAVACAVVNEEGHWPGRCNGRFEVRSRRLHGADDGGVQDAIEFRLE